MKNLLLCVLTGLLIACIVAFGEPVLRKLSEAVRAHGRNQDWSDTTGSNSPVIHIVEVGGHQYVVAARGQGLAIVHHEGCNAPSHHRP